MHWNIAISIIAGKTWDIFNTYTIIKPCLRKKMINRLGSRLRFIDLCTCVNPYPQFELPAPSYYYQFWSTLKNCNELCSTIIFHLSIISKVTLTNMTFMVFNNLLYFLLLFQIKLWNICAILWINTAILRTLSVIVLEWDIVKCYI